MNNKYYVYQHVDNDGTIMYIGMGSGCRVWTSYSRDTEHREWMEALMPSNFKWIIIAEGLTQTKACAIERNLINTITTKFNKGYAKENKNGQSKVNNPISKRSIPVRNKTTGEVFASFVAAGKSVNRNANSINNAVRGWTQQSAGMEWEYYEAI